MRAQRHHGGVNAENPRFPRLDENPPFKLDTPQPFEAAQIMLKLHFPATLR